MHAARRKGPFLRDTGTVFLKILYRDNNFRRGSRTQALQARPPDPGVGEKRSPPNLHIGFRKGGIRENPPFFILPARTLKVNTMKVQVFHFDTEEDSAKKISDKINKWFSENPNILIDEKVHVRDDEYVTIFIYYRDGMSL